MLIQMKRQTSLIIKVYNKRHSIILRHNAVEDSVFTRTVTYLSCTPFGGEVSTGQPVPRYSIGPGQTRY